MKQDSEKPEGTVNFKFSFYLKKSGALNHVPYVDADSAGTQISMDYSSDSVLSLLYPVNDEDPWKIFYDHCTFEEILKATNERFRDHNAPSISLTSKFPDDFHDLQRMTEEAWEQANLDYYRQVLMLIREYPESLYDDHIVKMLVPVLRTARWSADKEKAQEASCLLKDYLLPDFREHKTRVLPSPAVLRLSRRLLIHLAKRLSEECKRRVKEYLQYGYVTKEDILSEWPACYDHIIDWSRQNHGRIHLIAKKSRPLFKSLLFNPSDYANSLLTEYFQISLRTLKDRIKEPL